MKAKSLTAVGALHPLLFFVTVYIVALFLSIFICSSIFYSINDSSTAASDKKVSAPVARKEGGLPMTTAVVLR